MARWGQAELTHGRPVDTLYVWKQQMGYFADPLSVAIPVSRPCNVALGWNYTKKQKRNLSLNGERADLIGHGFSQTSQSNGFPLLSASL